MENFTSSKEEGSVPSHTGGVQTQISEMIDEKHIHRGSITNKDTVHLKKAIIISVLVPEGALMPPTAMSFPAGLIPSTNF